MSLYIGIETELLSWLRIVDFSKIAGINHSKIPNGKSGILSTRTLPYQNNTMSI